MSASDNIIGMVIISAIVIAGWLVIQMNETNTSIDFVEINQQSFELQRISSDLSEVLKISDPVTKLPVSKVIGDLVYSGALETNFEGVIINQKDYFLKKVFNSVYGEENYYMEVTPPLSKVRLYFVIDGSATMADDISKIAEVIPLFKSEVQKTFKDLSMDGKTVAIETNIFILWRGAGQDRNINCTKFAKLTDTICVDIEPDNKVNKIGSFSQYTDCSVALKKKGIYGLFNDSIYLPNDTFHYGFDSSKRANDCLSISSSLVQNYNYPSKILRGEFYEDWATATAYVAKSIPPEMAGDVNNPVLTLLFPISDELSTGSEADSCYNYVSSSSVASMEKCKVCNVDTNRFIRADKSIDHAVSYFSDSNVAPLGYRVFPILTLANYFAEDSKYCNPDGSLCSSGSSCVSCCGLVNCSGCNLTNGLHSDEYVIDEIREDMNRLALSTGGQVLDFTSGYDASKLSSAIVDLARASSIFTLGNEKIKQSRVERYAVNRIIPLGNNNVAELKFYLAKDRVAGSVKQVSYINLKPVAVINVRNSLGKIVSSGNLEEINGKKIFMVKIESTSYDPEGEKIDLNWYIDGVSLGKKVSSFDYNFEAEGDYNIQLEVFDSSGLMSSVSKIFSVSNIPIKQELIFVPVNWAGKSDNLFFSSANAHANSFLSNIPCPKNFLVTIISPSEASGCECFNNFNTSASNANTVLNKIKDCVKSVKGTSYLAGNIHKIVGLTGEEIGSGYMGYTYLFYDVMISDYTDPVVTPHELGHDYGSCDEYSIYEWTRQNNQLIANNYGGCVNPYPKNCNLYDLPLSEVNANIDSILCKKDDYCRFGLNFDSFETALNCPKKHNLDCNMFVSCGNNKCDSQAGENFMNCPKDCKNIDCFGQKIDATTRGIMGPSLVGTKYNSLLRKYTTEQKNYFINNICTYVE